MRPEISKISTVVRAKDQVSCDLAGEAVILNTKSGIYYGLNPVGARIWELIQEPTTIGAVLDSLLKEFDVTPERSQKELFALIEDMAARELISIEAGIDGANK